MIETFETFSIVDYCLVWLVWCRIVTPCITCYKLANALAVATIAGIYADNLTFVAEERNADLSTCLERSRFECVGSCIALETWLSVRDSQLYLGRQLSKKDGVGRSIRNNLANEALFEEINTCDKVVRDRHLLESLLVHEDVVLTLFVEVLVWTALNANILQFLTDVEAALQNATIYYIFELNTHNGVTLSWLNMQEVNYEIQTAVHTDTYTVLYILRVNHNSIVVIIYLIFSLQMGICHTDPNY